MEYGLYFNCRISEGGALSGRSLRPTYPSTHLDAGCKVEVLRTTLRSMRTLNFTKAIFNVDCEPQFKVALEDIMRMVPDLWPKCQIVCTKRRPETLAEWMRDTEKALDFFGAGMPILCVWNHDHVLVEYSTHIFEVTLNKIFPNNPDAFLYYSHQPEIYSMQMCQEAYDFRLASDQRVTRIAGPLKQVEEFIYHQKVSGWIDGIFVTRAAGLQKLWGGIRATQDYLPRPDWHGVTFPSVEFDIITTPREFFRHFDGYGHVTDLPSMLGLSFSDFDADGGFRTGQRIASLLKSMSREFVSGKFSNRDNESLLADLYCERFMQTMLLALRDSVYWRRVTGMGGTLKECLEKAVSIFLKYNFDLDVAILGRGDPNFYTVRKLFINRIFASVSSLSQAVISDVEMRI